MAPLHELALSGRITRPLEVKRPYALSAPVFWPTGVESGGSRSSRDGCRNRFTVASAAAVLVGLGARPGLKCRFWHFMVTSETFPNGEINLLFYRSVWPLRAVFSRLNIDGAQSARGYMRFTRSLDLTNALDLLYVDEIAAAHSTYLLHSWRRWSTSRQQHLSLRRAKRRAPPGRAPPPEDDFDGFDEMDEMDDALWTNG
eukprot:symbB.v1.2.016136.t1/scaffold1173.1/size181824/1